MDTPPEDNSKSNVHLKLVQHGLVVYDKFSLAAPVRLELCSFISKTLYVLGNTSAILLDVLVISDQMDLRLLFILLSSCV